MDFLCVQLLYACVEPFWTSSYRSKLANTLATTSYCLWVYLVIFDQSQRILVYATASLVSVYTIYFITEINFE